MIPKKRKQVSKLRCPKGVYFLLGTFAGQARDKISCSVKLDKVPKVQDKRGYPGNRQS